MSDIIAKRIRLLLYPGTHDAALDLLTAAAPIVWRGADMRVEIAIGATASTIETTITNITAIYMELHSSDRDGNLWTAPKTPDAVYNEITQQDWDGAVSTNCQYAWSVSKADMQIDLSATSQAERKNTFWLVFHGVLDTGEYVTFGAANLTIEEDGVQNDLGTVTPTASVKVENGDLYIYDNALGIYLRVYANNGALVAAPEE